MIQNFFYFVEKYKLGVIIPIHTTINKCPAKGFCRLHEVTDKDANHLAQEYLYGPHNDYQTKYTSKTHYICWISLWKNNNCGESHSRAQKIYTCPLHSPLYLCLRS